MPTLLSFHINLNSKRFCTRFPQGHNFPLAAVTAFVFDNVTLSLNLDPILFGTAISSIRQLRHTISPWTDISRRPFWIMVPSHSQFSFYPSHSRPLQTRNMFPWLGGKDTFYSFGTPSVKVYFFKTRTKLPLRDFRFVSITIVRLKKKPSTVTRLAQSGTGTPTTPKTRHGTQKTNM